MLNNQNFIFRLLPESETHKFLKRKIGEALEELGYEVELEKIVPEGRIDVHAEKEGEEDVNIEVWKTHMPDWIITKVLGNINGIKPNSKNISDVGNKDGFFLRNYCIGILGKNDDIVCTLCLKDGKLSEDLKNEKDLIHHLTQEHIPIDWTQYKSLDYGPEKKD